MTPTHPDIVHARQALIDGMLSYMQGDPEEPEFDAGYTEVEINQCVAILDEFLAALGHAKQPENTAAIMAATKQAVLGLNALNDACDGSLIETDQREQICAIMALAAQHAGLETDEDITEEWREW